MQQEVIRQVAGLSEESGIVKQEVIRQVQGYQKTGAGLSEEFGIV